MMSSKKYLNYNQKQPKFYFYSRLATKIKTFKNNLKQKLQKKQSD